MDHQEYSAIAKREWQTDTELLHFVESYRGNGADPSHAFTPAQQVYWSGKRVLDILFSLLGLLLLLPVMGLIALAIYLDDPGEVIFRQYRVGRNGEWFTVYKFRTMKRGTPKYLTSAQIQRSAVTRIGTFLRRTSLDELPQLINVLQGSMSLVGPRPLIPVEREVHQKRMQQGIYQLRPGITGLAQIRGRDTLCPEEKVRLDKAYLDSFSVWTDIRILLGTIPELLGYTKTADRTVYEAHIDDRQ